MDLLDLLLLVLVGAFWGCTNPFLRKGAAEVKRSTNNKDDANADADADVTSTTTEQHNPLLQTIRSSVVKFLNIRVWLPYALNQFGSVLFYLALSRSDLMLAVPICNGLSLVFSIMTSVALGETVDRPVRAIAGSVLVMAGVGICLHSRGEI